MKKVASVSSSPLFRSVAAVIIFFTCFIVFLIYTADISKKVDLIARERVIKEINVALSMLLYQSTIKGGLNELAEIHKKNPFIFLNREDYKTPGDYIGEVSDKIRPKARGWFYDRDSASVFYWDGDNRLFISQLQFLYRDVNGSGYYEPNIDVIEKLGMVSQ